MPIYIRQGTGHGDITLAEALAESCNVYFFHHAESLPPDALADWSRRFGFGQRTGVDLPGEARGIVPSPETNVKLTGHRWHTADAQAMAVGQGALTATPLQVARMMSAVANGGLLVTPHVMRDSVGNALRGVPDRQNAGIAPGLRNAMEGVPYRPIPGLTYSALAAIRAGLLRAVADKNGTAHDTLFLEQVSIAGATAGYSRSGSAASGGDGPEHAWFAGYVPADQPRYAMVVVLQCGWRRLFRRLSGGKETGAKVAGNGYALAMRIVHLIAGAGPMYCGSCMHGNTLAAGLRKAGADVLLAPLYTPLRTDEENLSIDHLALGGINVYLDECLPWWRRMPGFVRRLVDQPWLVTWAARAGGSTRPEQLGRLAVAMFRGDDGPLKDDVEQLLAWLRAEVRPEIIHLSNAMLAGLARPIKERLGVPVVATLTGEDSFLEKLPQPYYDQALAELRARAADLDCVIALSRDYADFMAGYLCVPREKIEVFRPGLNLEGFPVGPSCREGLIDPPVAGNVSAQDDSALSSPFQQKGPARTIGYLGRICEDKGPQLLLAAMVALDESPGVPPYRVRLAGYLDRADRRFLSDLFRMAKRSGKAERFEYVGELDRAGKIDFLQSLDVLCLPSLLRESKGLPALEAWACGVPAVLPDHGAFSELVADTDGGLLYDPQQPDELPSALLRILSDADLAAQCGRRAQQTVHERYTTARESQEMLELYERLVR